MNKDKLEHVSLQVGLATQIGKAHKEKEQSNADAVKVLYGSDLDIPGGQPVGLLILADGVGDKASASHASKIVVQSVSRKAKKCLKNHTISLTDLSDETLYDVMIQSALFTHNTVLNNGNGGESAFVGALWIGRRVFVSYIGDSRAYVIDVNGSRRMTQDHSLVQMRYIDRLGLSEHRAWEKASRNGTDKVLCKAAGARYDICPGDVRSKIKQSGVWVVKEDAWVMRDGEQLLLCSDGLWSVLNDDCIFSIVTKANTPQDACDQLISAARQAGSDDDISVIVAVLRASQE